jgi:hypothetical protein
MTDGSVVAVVPSVGGDAAKSPTVRSARTDV